MWVLSSLVWQFNIFVENRDSLFLESETSLESVMSVPIQAEQVIYTF